MKKNGIIAVATGPWRQISKSTRERYFRLTAKGKNMINPRNFIITSLARRKWSWLKLSRESRVSYNSIWRFLKGLSDLNGDNLGKVLAALDLEISKRKGKP